MSDVQYFFEKGGISKLVHQYPQHGGDTALNIYRDQYYAYEALIVKRLKELEHEEDE